MKVFNITSKFLINAAICFFSASIFLGCSGWYNDNTPAPLLTATLTGQISTEGAIPASLIQASSIQNSRTAVANEPSGTKSYTCTVTNSANTPILDYTFNTTYDSVNDIQYYSITGLPVYATETSYYITITYRVGTNEFLKSIPQEVTISQTSSYFRQDFVLRPINAGSGSIALSVSLDTSIASLVSTASMVLDPLAGGSTVSAPGVIEDDTITFNKSSIESGAYTATFSFYRTFGGNVYLLYQFEDVVNVFQNCVTNRWVKNSDNQDYLSTSGSTTTCQITQSCISNFISTNFYVDKTTTASLKTGSYLEPFDSVENAIKYVNTFTTDDTKTYTIHVRKIIGNVNEGTHLVSNKIDLARNITIECWNTTPGDALGTTKIKLSDSFTDSYMFSIGSRTLTLKGEVYLDGNSKTADGIVSDSSGEFEMNGGRIENFRTGILMDTGNTSIVRLYGGLLQYNSDYAVKVLAGILKVRGGIKVKNNPFNNGVKNLYLTNSEYIQVYGQFTSGAELWVTTASLPQTLNASETIATSYSTYNTASAVSTYFKSDTWNPVRTYGTSVIIETNGGSLSQKYKDDITIYTPTTLTRSPNAAKIVSFQYKNGATNLTGSSDISATYSVKSHGGSVSSGTNKWGFDYSVSGYKSIKLYNGLANQDYDIVVTITYKGNTYTADYLVKAIPYIENATITGVVGTQSQSEIFKAGRTVEIGKLIVSDHEVTQGEYETFCFYGETSPTGGNGMGTNYPAYYVSWYDAIVYCNLRSMAEGLTPYYKIGSETDPREWPDKVEGTGANAGKYCGPSALNDSWNTISYNASANGWRLPTDVEWEYLARAGNTEDFKYSGSNTCSTVAWSSENASYISHEVKTLTPNSLGLYDMSGNVAEWVWDWYASSSSINSSTPLTGPSGGTSKVIRGYGYTDAPANMELAARAGYQPDQRSYSLGFRVVRNAD